jgi:hypothetical protein
MQGRIPLHPPNPQVYQLRRSAPGLELGLPSQDTSIPRVSRSNQGQKGGAISGSGDKLNNHSPSNLQLDISQSLPITPSSKRSPLDPHIEPLKTILPISKIPNNLPRPIFRILSLNCVFKSQALRQRVNHLTTHFLHVMVLENDQSV